MTARVFDRKVDTGEVTNAITGVGTLLPSDSPLSAAVAAHRQGGDSGGDGSPGSPRLTARTLRLSHGRIGGNDSDR